MNWKVNTTGGGSRRSNIELCRIVSMLLIVLLHSTYASFGYPANIDKESSLVLLFSSISIYGVDVFLLISGYFGLKPKYSSIANILFICLFAAICRIVLSSLFESFNYSQLFFISKSNWFIVCYLGLIIFSPILNIFIENTSQKQLKLIITLFFAYSLWFSVFPKQADIDPGFNNGCSIIWFIEVYLIGRYLKIHGIPLILKNHSKVIWFSSIIMILLGQVLLIKCGFSNYLPWWGAQNQPVVLLAAISFFITFCNIDIQSSCINAIAQSTLFVLLMHSPEITKKYFQYINKIDNMFLAIVFWIIGVFAIYAICTIIDQIRKIIYQNTFARIFQ